jgi:hypothetical protein
MLFLHQRNHVITGHAIDMDRCAGPDRPADQIA